MNKNEIRDKNIVLDLSRQEFSLLLMSVGYCLETIIQDTGNEGRKEVYLAVMKSERDALVAFGWRMNDAATAALTLKV